MVTEGLVLELDVLEEVQFLPNARELRQEVPLPLLLLFELLRLEIAQWLMMGNRPS